MKMLGENARFKYHIITTPVCNFKPYCLSYSKCKKAVCNLSFKNLLDDSKHSYMPAYHPLSNDVHIV
jgi:hypothetical protein